MLTLETPGKEQIPVEQCITKSEYPQHVRQPALTWQVFTDDVCGLYSTGHGGMDNFIEL